MTTSLGNEGVTLLITENLIKYGDGDCNVDHTDQSDMELYFWGKIDLSTYACC